MDTTFSCAICLDDYSEAEVAHLPCCLIPPTATTRFCKRCIEIICERSAGNTGRCPNCRNFLKVGADGLLQVTNQMDTCTCCGKISVIVHSRGHAMLCDACFLCMERPLLYECEGCGRFQRIPHPMYRYQPAPGEFGANTWACAVRCGVQTRWRIKSSELAEVPAEDYPESWGQRDEWIASVRTQRLAERQAGVRVGGPLVDAAGYRQEAAIFVVLGCALGSLALPDKVCGHHTVTGTLCRHRPSALQRSRRPKE